MLSRERPRTPAFLPPTPLPSLTMAFSRRAALFGAVTVTSALGSSAASAIAALPVAVSRPQGPLTLGQAEALDFEALWRSLPAEAQVHIGALVLRSEMFLQLNEDGGFHITDDDRDVAEGLSNDALDDLRPAIWAALPDVMPTVYDEPYPLWQALDGRHPPTAAEFHGLGRIPLVRDGWEWFAVTGTTSTATCCGSSEGAPMRSASAPAGEIRALTMLDAVPTGCRALEIRDDRHAPHLRAGEVAVIDPSDCDPVHGELFAVQYGNLTAWWCVSLDDPKSWAECEARMDAGRMLRMADGPYRPGGLESRTLGRVVGLLQPSKLQVRHDG